MYNASVLKILSAAVEAVHKGTRSKYG